MIEILYASGILLGLFIIANLPKWLGFKSERYGTAKLEEKTSKLQENNKGLVINKKKRLSEQDSVKHMLVVAPSSAGKTQNFVLPNALMIESSMVLIDIKGELYSTCANFLAKKGFKIKVIDLEDTTKSLCYNPLKRLKSDSDSQEFAEALFDMSNNGATTEGIWRNGSIALIKVIIECLRHTKDYYNLANVIKLLNVIDATNGGKALYPFFAMFGRINDGEPLETYKRISSQEPKIFAGQHANAVSVVTSQFGIKELKYLTVNDDLDFSEFRKSKTVLFIKVPVGKMVAYSGFITILFNQLFNYLLSNNPGPCDQTVYCLLEEFGNLKRIRNFGQVCSLIRSQKVSLSIVAQDMTQIDNIYGEKESNTIINNCASHLILPGIMNPRTLQFYNTLIGTQTLEEFDESDERIIHKRDLLNIDEIRRIKKGQGLFLHSNENPVKIRLKPLYKNYELMAKAGLQSKNNQIVPIHPPLSINRRLFPPISYLDLKWLNWYIQKQAKGQTQAVKIKEKVVEAMTAS